MRDNVVKNSDEYGHVDLYLFNDGETEKTLSKTMVNCICYTGGIDWTKRTINNFRIEQIPLRKF